MPLSDLDSRYEWRDLGGVCVVRTARAWSDPSDPLNQRTPAIDWPDQSVFSVFDHVAQLLYPHVPAPYTGLNTRALTARSASG